MIVIMVLVIFFVMVLLDIFIFNKTPYAQPEHKEEVEQEIYYTPEVGFTMCDGGKKIEEKEKL